MDDQDKALNEKVEVETTVTDTPSVQETPEPVEEATPEVEESPKKKGAEKRIRKLNTENHSLKDKIAELTKPNRQGDTQLPPIQPQVSRKPLVGDDESIDSAELERRMQEREQQAVQRADNMASLRTRQVLTLDRINREAEDVVQNNSELDPTSDSFDQELSDTIYEAVEAKVKADPSASVKSFVDRQMKLYRRGVTKEEKAEQKVVEKQADQTAIKPTQNKPVEKSFSDLSIEEMEAKLGTIDI